MLLSLVAWLHGQKAYSERFCPMFEGLFKCAYDNREVMPLYAITKDLELSSSYQPGHAVIASIQAKLQEGIAAGEYRVLDTEKAAYLMHGLVEGAMRYWMLNPTKRRMVSTLDQLTEFARRLILND